MKTKTKMNNLFFNTKAMLIVLLLVLQVTADFYK